MFQKALIEGGFCWMERWHQDSSSVYLVITTSDNKVHIVDAVENVNLNNHDDLIDFNEISMIGFLVGKSLPHQFVCACAFRRWKGLCDMTYHDKGFFAFTFDCEKSRNEALSMGFIILSDSVMVFKPWQSKANTEGLSFDGKQMDVLSGPGHNHNRSSGGSN
ncbi:hypothetical protein POM88_018193 [Heracleum sosnowskyi]|uniref:DUF4283 domain-containing protein n=1 Tax=Heracleum sosnowskyi TaxID=360622 RepID=A0AAD8MUI1_9APIA|nr:hypothetical protein POM88_018193 [Heracleum sosnowskyi]